MVSVRKSFLDLDGRISSFGSPNPDQRTEALKNANRIRTGISEVRKELAVGALRVDAALEDNRAHAITIGTLLLAQPRWGPKRVREFLRRVEIREGKRVGELTERQRGVIADALSKCSR